MQKWFKWDRIQVMAGFRQMIIWSTTCFSKLCYYPNVSLTNGTSTFWLINILYKCLLLILFSQMVFQFYLNRWIYMPFILRKIYVVSKFRLLHVLKSRLLHWKSKFENYQQTTRMQLEVLNLEDTECVDRFYFKNFFIKVKLRHLKSKLV